MMVIFVYITSFCLLLGQLAYVDLGSGIRFYMVEPVLLLIIMTGLFRLGIAQIKRLLRFKPVVFWFVWIIFGWLLSGISSGIASNLQSALYIVRLIVFVCASVYLAQATLTTKMRAMIYLIPAVCLLQYMFLPDLRFLQQYGWDPHMYRAVGLIFDPPVVGSVLGILWTGLFMRFDHHGMSLGKVPTTIKLLLVAIFLSVIFLYSRSTYISLLFVTSIYLVSKKRWTYLAVFIGLTLFAIRFAPLTIPTTMNLESSKLDRSSTTISRMTEIREGVAAWQSSPLFGIGYGRVADYKSFLNQYRTTALDNHAKSAFHSFWVTQLASTGIVGLALLLSILFKIVQWRRELLYPILWVSIIGVFDNVVFHPLVLLAFILLFISKPSIVPNSKL